MACMTYNQGATATLPAQFVTSPDGSPIDVPDATVEVFAPDMSVALPPTAMVQVQTGFYYYFWAIPNSQPVGAYTVRYTGTVLGIPSVSIDKINIVASGGGSPVTSDGAAFAVAALERYLSCAQNIPVYRETARRTGPARKIYQLSWPRWNLGNHLIKLNNDIVDTGYTLSLDTGTLTFDTPLHYSDKVSASYNFRFFSQEDMLRFISDALSKINYEAPGTNFTIDNIPPSYIGLLMQGAAAIAIQKLLLCLIFQEPATIFGGPEGAQAATGNLNSLKQNYEQQFTDGKKQIKRAIYPSTVGVIQPEYTLPGGRARWFRYLFSGSLG